MRYSDAGVDITSLNAVKRQIAKLVQRTFDDNVLSGIGLFGGLYRIGDQILICSVDSVGTKLKVAQMADCHETVGFDIVNHCVNDILTLGAKPLFFLDYITFSEIKPDVLMAVFRGLADACAKAKIALIGGETAQLPDYFKPQDYDLVGYIVGTAQENELIKGNEIAVGNKLVGLFSSGLHTNGYSLIRKIFFKDNNYSIDHLFPELKRPLGVELLTPHRLYLDEITKSKTMLKGIVHITGGGFPDNIPRILPPGLGVHIDKDSWNVPPIFKLIQELGGVPEDEMYHTFNMGIGMILIVDKEDLPKILELTGGIEIGSVVDKEGVNIE